MPRSSIEIKPGDEVFVRWNGDEKMKVLGPVTVTENVANTAWASLLNDPDVKSPIIIKSTPFPHYKCLDQNGEVMIVSKLQMSTTSISLQSKDSNLKG